jgi:hypothetical protein
MTLAAQTPDPGSFGGHPYTPDELALGYGTDHDPRDEGYPVRLTKGEARLLLGLLTSVYLVERVGALTAKLERVL